MAANKKHQEVVDEIPAEVEVLEPSQDEMISGLLSELSGMDAVEIAVCEVDGRKRPYLFSYDLDQMSLRELKDHLRDEFGSGEYCLEVRRGGAFVGRRSLSIRAPRKLGVTSVPRETSDGGDRLASVLEAIAQSNNNTRELMFQMQQQSSAQMIDLMKTMMARDSGGGSGLDVISLLGTAKELFATRDNSVSVLLQGIKLARELEPEKSEGLGSVVETLGKPLVELTRQLAARQQFAVPGELVGNAGEGAGDVNVGNQSEGSEDMGVLSDAMVRAAVGMFMKAAASGADCGIYAQLFVDQYGDMVPDEFIIDDGQFNRLFILCPDAEQYRSWFMELREKITSLMFEDDQNAND